jgi:hypothetical protein
VRPLPWFATVGVNQIEHVLTDDAMAYRRSRAFRQAVHDLGAR